MIEKPFYEDLEQYDYVGENDDLKSLSKYGRPIGAFVIQFSLLEHELNLAVAQIISDRSHEPGYVVIEGISYRNKVDLFYRMHLRLVGWLDGEVKKKLKQELTQIREELLVLGVFRNSIVHANWHTLNSAMAVRTKIVIDDEMGHIKFRMTKICPKDIAVMKKKAARLVTRIDEYNEGIWSAL